MKFALVDCNNFFVSCERVFNPKLEGRPVVVMSSNDGCIVARSNEAKALGIPMGAPVFMCRELLEKNRVVMLSGNHALYADLSRRVMATLAEFNEDLEVYSVDEAFLKFPPLDARGGRGSSSDVMDQCRTIRAAVRQRTGIPVSIGIAGTKTLAKAANHVAKKQVEHGGVFSLPETADVNRLLATFPVEEVWGIGRQLTKMLNANGVRTAAEFIAKPDDWIRRRMGIYGLRVAWELRGVACTALDSVPEHRKSVISSRSFGRPVTTLFEMKQSVAWHAASAAETLREEHLKASVITVFLGHRRQGYGMPYPSGLSIEIAPASNFTPDIASAAHLVLEKTFRSGATYKKAGVMLTGIIPEDATQLNLFVAPQDEDRRRKVMEALDRVNVEWGSGTLRYAAEGIHRGWTSKSAKRSGRLTTDWDELPNIT